MDSFVSDASGTTVLNSFRENHPPQYVKLINSCCDALSVEWTQMGVPGPEVQAELTKVTSTITQVWRSAVRDIEKQKEHLYHRIRETESEIHAIQTQMGERTSIVLPQTEMILKHKLDALLLIKERCIKAKHERIEAFKSKTLFSCRF